MGIQKHPLWQNVQTYRKPALFLQSLLGKRVASLFPQSAFIAVSGSYDLEDTVIAADSVLETKYKTISPQLQTSSFFSIPKTLLHLRPKTKKVILKMDATTLGEMDLYLSLVKPAVAVISRIFSLYSEFSNKKEVAGGELVKLMRALPKEGFAILNWDDIYCRRLANETAAQVVFYGTDPENCHVFAQNIRLENYQTAFSLNYGVERVEVKLKIFGRHFVYPALAAAALALTADLTLINAKKGLEKMEGQEHYFQLLEGMNGFLILDNSANASCDGLDSALNTINEIEARRRIVVISENKDFKASTEHAYRLIGQKIYKDKVDYILLGSGEVRFIADELVKLGFSPERIELNLTNQQIAPKILRIAGKGDIILINGPFSSRLDEVVQRVAKVNKKS